MMNEIGWHPGLRRLGASIGILCDWGLRWGVLQRTGVILCDRLWRVVNRVSETLGVATMRHSGRSACAAKKRTFQFSGNTTSELWTNNQYVDNLSYVKSKIHPPNHHPIS
ncbi:hypothetical protein [Paraburkholderia xenovorans]